MRLDGVEIKVNLEDALLARAVDTLGLGEGDPMRVWFFEDLSPGAHLPLLEAGLIVRVRVKESGKGDCTVKLRPCLRSQLPEPWLSTTETEGLELRLEEDRTGARRVLAASLQGDVGRDELALVEAGAALPGGVVAGRQMEYVDQCATADVNLATLAALGPVRATRWKEVGPTALAALGVRAERWTVAGLDFLELSLKVETRDSDDGQGADAAARDLDAALADLGLTPAEGGAGETKTRRVLEALAAAVD